MKILFIGDIFGSPGRRIVADHLQDIIKAQGIHLAIANAENSAGGFGITPSIAEDLFALGLDALTTGNHIWDKREISTRLAEQTVLGAAKLVRETGLHPAILRDQVITPGGVTISAIHELERHGLRSMLISAIETATRHSEERTRALEAKIDS